VSTIIKGVKRAMAGEYSRELSAKVFRGQCRLIEVGYRQGGPAGFGLRRMLLDQKGERKAVLARGEHKSLQTNRVVLVQGPGDEVDVVREIYRRFIHDGLVERQIADLLNARGILATEDSAWTRGRIHSVLTNEKYIGNNVWTRRGGRNGGPQQYDLVCGQGRLEAFQTLGQREVPAFVVNASKDEARIVCVVQTVRVEAFPGAGALALFEVVREIDAAPRVHPRPGQIEYPIEPPP
jgi:hypothetical protein